MHHLRLVVYLPWFIPGILMTIQTVVGSLALGFRPNQISFHEKTFHENSIAVSCVQPIEVAPYCYTSCLRWGLGPGQDLTRPKCRRRFVGTTLNKGNLGLKMAEAFRVGIYNTLPRLKNSLRKGWVMGGDGWSFVSICVWTNFWYFLRTPQLLSWDFFVWTSGIWFCKGNDISICLDSLLNLLVTRIWV